MGGSFSYIIYKVTNKINGKIYIGFDSNWPKRKNEHKSSSFNNKKLDYNYAFHRAIRRYGWEAFEWEVLYEHWDGQYTLNVLEPYFIDVYNSIENGYNMTKGGDGCLGYKHSNKDIQKISESKKGIPLSEEHKLSISNSKAKNWLLIDPQGNEYKITNLKKICKDNPNYKLLMRHLSSVANGRKNHYKKWKCYKI